MTILVDTGPLVAVLDRRDAHHAWALEHFARLKPPLLTCEAVVSEATFLLGLGPEALSLISLIERGVVCVGFQLESHVGRVRGLMDRFASVPMAFADACLVRMTELHDNAMVWTTDSDFRVYRRHGRGAISTLLPSR